MNNMINNNVYQSNMYDLTWQDEPTNATVRMTWFEAHVYKEKLNAEEHCGYTDWRLPTLDELKTLVDKRQSPAVVDGVQHCACSSYWSSTTNASHSGVASRVNFQSGYGLWGNKSYSYYVRCVRSGQ